MRSSPFLSAGEGDHPKRRANLIFALVPSWNACAVGIYVGVEPWCHFKGGFCLFGHPSAAATYCRILLC